VKEERHDLEAMIAGQTQMAWKKNRDYHLIAIRPVYPEPLWQQEVAALFRTRNRVCLSGRTALS